MKKRVPAERYTGAAAVWRALDGPGVKLLRASYLIELARDGGVLQRRQDLPDKAFIPLMQLQRSHADASSLITGFDGALPIVAVSACWITNTHADPRGQNLKIVGAYLAREVPKYKAVALDGGNGFDHVGIFWDWALSISLIRRVAWLAGQISSARTLRARSMIWICGLAIMASYRSL